MVHPWPTTRCIGPKSRSNAHLQPPRLLEPIPLDVGHALTEQARIAAAPHTGMRFFRAMRYTLATKKQNDLTAHFCDFYATMCKARNTHPPINPATLTHPPTAKKTKTRRDLLKPHHRLVVPRWGQDTPPRSTELAPHMMCSLFNLSPGESGVASHLPWVSSLSCSTCAMPVSKVFEMFGGVDTPHTHMPCPRASKQARTEHGNTVCSAGLTRIGCRADQYVVHCPFHYICTRSLVQVMNCDPPVLNPGHASHLTSLSFWDGTVDLKLLDVYVHAMPNLQRFEVRGFKGDAREVFRIKNTPGCTSRTIWMDYRTWGTYVLQTKEYIDR